MSRCFTWFPIGGLGEPNIYQNLVNYTMKNLLIILISIFLLSSTVIGQETGVLYLYESSSGFVLKSFGDGKVQPKYKGEITNGKPNGFGVLTYPYGEKSVVGEWKNGKEWNTKHTKKDGTIIGRLEGKENGQVTFTWFIRGNRGKYVGEWKNGMKNGQGTWTLSDGSKYVGEFKNGEIWNVIGYKKNGNIDGKWVNGESIRQ